MRPLLCLHLVLSFLTWSGFGQVQRPPSILLIVSDDQGYGDVSNMGHPVLKTPHLDRLKSESVWLKNFRTAPLCSPTRASLMTGRHQYRTGVWDTWRSRCNMAGDEVTLAEYLQEAGYETALSGKWHLGANYPFRPIDQGFDHSFTWASFDRFSPLMSTDEQPAKVYEGGYLDDLITDEAIRFISQARTRPFFSYVAFYNPHDHWKKQISDDYTRRFLDLSDLSAKDAEVMGMITNVDDNVGRLLSALKESGQEDNTLVVFMSDNGLTGRQQSAARFNAGLRGRKGQVYEGGVRVPCYLRLPGRLRPRTLSQATACIDLLPTLLDAVGRKPNRRLIDGISLWPLLCETVSELPDRYLFQQQQPQSSGKTPRPFMNASVIGLGYKLVFPNAESAPELYDLRYDEAESNNVARQNPDIVEKLRRTYLDWFAQMEKDRGFAPIPNVIGSPQQPSISESVLQLDGSDGYLARVERAGVYRITFGTIQNDLFPQGGELGFTDGKEIWKAKVDGRSDTLSFEARLPAGLIRLKPWSRGKKVEMRYVLGTEDYGHRNFSITFLHP